MDKVHGVSKEAYEMHLGFNAASIPEKYDKLCENYDEVYLTAGWPDPRQIADSIIKHMESLVCQDGKRIKVFDVGCGSGLVGQYLLEDNCDVEVVGVDASDGMLELARQKGSAYDTLEYLFVTTPDELPEKYTNVFDIVASAGLLAEGHASPDIFDVKLKAVKQGGLIMFTVRQEYLESLGYGPKMEQAIDEGKMVLIEKYDYEKYGNMKDNPVGRFSPVISQVYIFRKL